MGDEINEIYILHSLPQTVNDIDEIRVSEHVVVLIDNHRGYATMYETQKPVLISLPMKSSTGKDVYLKLKPYHRIKLMTGSDSSLTGFTNVNVNETEDAVILKFEENYHYFTQIVVGKGD